MDCIYAVSLLNLGPLKTVYGMLDTEVKSQRCGSACRYNCSAVAFYCYFLICYFGFLVLIKFKLAQVKKRLTYALSSVLCYGKNKQTVVTKYCDLTTTRCNITVNLSHDYRLTS